MLKTLSGMVTFNRFAQPENVDSLMLVMPQLPNASLPISVTLLGIVTLVRPQHERNAESPTVVTFSGIDRFVRLLQFENADGPMLTTLSGIEIPSSLVQPSKAIVPMLVTELGSLMKNHLLPKKASGSIEVTGKPSIVSGIPRIPVTSRLQPVILISSLVFVQLRFSRAGTGSNSEIWRSNPMSELSEVKL